MNNLVLTVLACLCAVGALLMWEKQRAELVEARREISNLQHTRKADNEALSRLQAERDEISRRYETITRELAEITDEPSVDYLNTPVPDSVRRLFQR